MIWLEICVSINRWSSQLMSYVVLWTTSTTFVICPSLLMLTTVWTPSPFFIAVNCDVALLFVTNYKK